MSLLLLVFLFFCGVLLAAQIGSSISIKKQKIAVNYHEIASNKIDLLCNGNLLRHIMHNDAQGESDEEQLSSYRRFLGEETNINGMKNIKGMVGYHEQY
jgi:hypothetical protein